MNLTADYISEGSYCLWWDRNGKQVAAVSFPSTTCHIQEANREQVSHLQVLPAIFQKANKEQVCHYQVLPAIFKKANREQVCHSKYYLPYSRRQTGNRCVIPSTTCHIPEGKQGTSVSVQVLPAIFQKSGVNSGLLIPQLVCILPLVTTLWFVGFLRTDM